MAIDIHHIFPQDWCEKQMIPRKNYNAIVNKTPISYKANRMIGGVAPSQYLHKLQQHKQVLLDDAKMDAILESHLIPASLLRTDNFAEFYRLRKQQLLVLIEKAMGKESVAMHGIDGEEEVEGDEQGVTQL